MKPLLRVTRVTKPLNRIICMDALTALKKIEDESVDLIVTSPPYAQQRKKAYNGIKASEYCDWFIPIAIELKRVLKKEGSLIINIKENVNEGERHTYVLDLIVAMKMIDWLWTEEYIWHKKNSFPGKWPNRFRDSWERCLHFTKEKKFKMFQEEVMVPMGDWKERRIKSQSDNDKVRTKSSLENQFSKKIINWKDRTMAYPTNVLHMSTECSNTGHPAAFPVQLPKWFIKLFTAPNDTVLDPFIGSGTTAVAAMELKRNFIGIEIDNSFAKLACDRIDNYEWQESRKLRSGT